MGGTPSILLKARTVAKTATVSVLFPDGIFVGISDSSNLMIYKKQCLSAGFDDVPRGTISTFAFVHRQPRTNFIVSRECRERACGGLRPSRSRQLCFPLS